MYTDKDSNLTSDVRTKYGEESVNSIRKWEITVKKMADYRNHRRFTLRCIKASITPVSCKLKNPLSSKSIKSYQIIHKAEKQLLYERIRNINYILEKLDKQRESQYKKFKDMLFKPNQHVQGTDPSPEADLDLERSRLFINKIKKHRHNKIKGKHIDKFKRLFFKHYGYFDNLTRQTTNVDNINQENTFSRHPNVPSSFPRTSTPASGHSTVPATSMAPTPSSSTAPALAPRPQQSNQLYTCIDCTNKWVINLSRIPPHPGTIITSTKRTKFCHYPQIPPIEAYISAVEQASSKLPTHEAEEFRSDINKLHKQQQQSHHNNQCNINPPLQGPHTTQARQLWGGSHSRQRGGHGDHGPRGIHQQSPNTSSRHQHIQSTQKGPNQPTQK